MPSFVTSIFTRERFGRPQLMAAAILLAFLAQCLVFCARVPLTDGEIGYLEAQRGFTFFSPGSSLARALASALPSVLRAGNPDNPWLRWLARAPFLIAGLLFGASLWYVARRLFGDRGGYIALALYAFSPWFVIHSATVGPEIVAEWAAFGAIFTAIGVAHTLYAPREVILWNWKRILLLGAAIGIGCAADPAVVLVIPAALAFMWYLAPGRRGAATAILLTACAVAFPIDCAFYGFHAGRLWFAMRSSLFALASSHAFAAPITWGYAADFLFFQQPMTALLLLAALTVFVAWKHTRFFGTASALMMFAYLMLVGVGSSVHGALPFYLLALPFGFVFIAGVATDLLESRYGKLSLGIIVGILVGHALISLVGLCGL